MAKVNGKQKGNSFDFEEYMFQYRERDYIHIHCGDWVEVDQLAPSGLPRYAKVVRKYYVDKNWFGWLLRDIDGASFIASPIELTPITEKEAFELGLKGEL